MLNKKIKNNSLIKKYQKLINEINQLEKNLKTVSNQELRLKNLKLQQTYQKTKNLNRLIPLSFALTREVSQRGLGLRHFDVQLMGGLALNDNKIAEMKTGEGKTLVATLPASLNALTKRGVHIVTVNDYLANRDQASMGQIYRRLGFNTGLIQQDLNPKIRRINYQSDITYVTNHELAFDFLKDNLTYTNNATVLRSFNYCIIDEVDSILIDEAQTPLIISGQKPEKTAEKYVIASEVIKYLKINEDFKVNEKEKNVQLLPTGFTKIEKLVQVDNLYNLQDPWIPFLINALRAETLFFKNVHYIVQKKRIVIVDEFTGRLMPDRQWGDGLHQAIEAKENLPIRARSETHASITYQNFFLMYPKLSGMTGTGKTTEIEFEKIYNLSVDVIPTALPSKRNDLLDSIYVDQFSKWNAIAQFCKEIFSKIGQPILIGTKTVEKSEMLAQLLDEYKLPYELLNAKPENIRREAQIISQAGKQNSITIATNMAGRGTDIILGGNIDFQALRDIFEFLSIVKKSINQLIINFKNLNDRKLRHKLLKEIQKFKKFRQTLGCSQKLYTVLLTMIKNETFLLLSEVDLLKMLQENDRIAIPKTVSQNTFRFLCEEIKVNLTKHHKQETEIVKNLGGLYVIGTERNESRRIDNQLRGRCGRQGDPGISHFFLSLDDDILRLFGGLKIQNFMQNQISEQSPIESNLITNSLDSAQQRIEERAYEQRKNLYDYDSVINNQRNFIYYHRRMILLGRNYKSHNLAYGEIFICQLFKKLQQKKLNPYNIFEQLSNLTGRRLDSEFYNTLSINWKNYQLKEWKNYFYQEFWLQYLGIIETYSVYGHNSFNAYEKRIGLNLLDQMWQEHIEKLGLLKDAVTWRVFDQSLPLVEYKRDAYQIFLNRYDEVIFNILHRTIRTYII